MATAVPVFVLVRRPPQYSDEETQVIGVFSDEDKAVRYLTRIGVDLDDSDGEFDIQERILDCPPTQEE